MEQNNNSFTITTMVTDYMTASHVESGDLPVLATPVMITLMEKAAANCLKPMLPQGLTSVGVEINVRHLSATPVAATVKVQARLTSHDERRAVFVLEAWDDAGLIGEGSHTRAIVDAQRLLKKANEKING